MITWFVKRYLVDMSSAIETNPLHYANFNDFFTRALKPNARPLVIAENAIACPVDGYVSQIGLIRDGRIFQAKGFDFELQVLLGNDSKLTQEFQNGNFATLYLAPKNYHRIHMPLTGTLQQMIYVPGQLFSVNQQTVQHVPRLFARNERVITVFQTDIGLMAVILVGAMVVASIETVWAGEVAPTRTRKIQQWQYPNSAIILERGAELGRFKMGSTVIVLFQPNRIIWSPEISPESEIRHRATFR